MLVSELVVHLVGGILRHHMHTLGLLALAPRLHGLLLPLTELELESAGRGGGLRHRERVRSVSDGDRVCTQVAARSHADRFFIEVRLVSCVTNDVRLLASVAVHLRLVLLHRLVVVCEEIRWLEIRLLEVRLRWISGVPLGQANLLLLSL